jgi:hypothetical protein
VSSHREAPYISSDPVADNTDVYAFVSPDAPDTVTIIANFIPLEAPAGGPNFYQFGDDVRYEINISNSGTQTDISYQFTFSTAAPNPAAGFLYNTGPITSLSDPAWNRKQTYDVTKVTYDGTKGGNASRVGSSLPCPPCNIGPLSTPNYSSLAAAAVKTLATGEKVFAGQRADAFFVDLGAVFDLADLRPFARDQHARRLERPHDRPSDPEGDADLRRLRPDGPHQVHRRHRRLCLCQPPEGTDI